MLAIFFGVKSVREAADARRCDRDRFTRFFHAMIERGIYFPPSPFEAAFVSLAHRKEDLEKALEAFEAWTRAESRG